MVVALGPSRWPYTPAPCDDSAPVPALPIVLTGPGGSVSCRGVLDSGADRSAIPLEYAEALGVDLTRAKRLNVYANGADATYLEPAETIAALYEGGELEFRPVFGPWPQVLLGLDVFQAFRVTFDQRAGEFFLHPYQEA